MPVSESELIDAFLAPFGGGEGVGSDCAAVRVRRGTQLVATTDAVVEGVHFTLPAFTPEQVGWKALAVNLSDLAAAGARPRWFLCALGVPRGPRALALARRMARGMAALSRRHGCALVGGNVTRAAQWSLTLTALGEAKKPLMRWGARPGDLLLVAGTLGDAAAGLRPSPSAPALRAQRRPTPLVRQGIAAAACGATAAIDVSDGFLKDLRQLCSASRVGAVVDCGALPLGKAARALPDGLQLALTGGEDYALLIAMPEREAGRYRLRERCKVVGRITRGQEIVLTERGRPRAPPRHLGFDHLK